MAFMKEKQAKAWRIGKKYVTLRQNNLNKKDGMV